MANNIPSCIESCDFPTDTLKWMKKKAAPKMTVKLMKCHKFFQYPEFPFEVVHRIANGWQSKWFSSIFGVKKNYAGEECLERRTKKFWITECIVLNHFAHGYLNDSKFIHTLIPKIAVSDISVLYLRHQKLSFDEFKFLVAANNLKDIYLYNTTINFDNGAPVYLVDIVKCLPSVEKFVWLNGNTPIFDSDFSNTFKNIEVSNVKRFKLHMISFSYFVLFSKFVDHNPHIQYRLEFIDGSLSAEETQILEKYVQRIIDAAGITEYPPPYIRFPGQNINQHNNLCSLVTKFY